MDRAIHRFGRTLLICPSESCTRLSGHYAECSHQRGRHRPDRTRGPVTPSDATPQLPAPLARPNDAPSITRPNL